MLCIFIYSCIVVSCTDDRQWNNGQYAEDQMLKEISWNAQILVLHMLLLLLCFCCCFVAYVVVVVVIVSVVTMVQQFPVQHSSQKVKTQLAELATRRGGQSSCTFKKKMEEEKRRGVASKAAEQVSMTLLDV